MTTRPKTMTSLILLSAVIASFSPGSERKRNPDARLRYSTIVRATLTIKPA